MSKFLKIVLSLLLVICFTFSVSAEENQFIVQADDITAKYGETVAVKFSLQNNPGISMASFNIVYDENVLRLTEINGNQLMGGIFTENVEENYVSWMSFGGDSTFCGVVFTAIFEVTNTANLSETEVTLASAYDDSILNYDGEVINFVTIPCKVMMALNTSYDIDKNGKIDAGDIIKARRILLKIDSGNFDVNNDGKTNIMDLIKLKKALLEI